MRFAPGIAFLCLLGTILASAATNRTLQLHSPAYRNGGAIPVRYGCAGADVSPPINWSGTPPGTRSFALVLYDRDAADAGNPELPWVHWLLYDIPAKVHGLAEDAAKNPPAGTLNGENSWRRSGYDGPCPPSGSHRYVFILYVLDIVPANLHAPGMQALEAAMRGHILAEAQLTGDYEKPRRD